MELMKFQRDTWSCGAAVVVNALRVFGVKVNEYTIRGVSGTTRSQGTDEEGIMRAVRAWGFSAAPYTTNSKHNAWEWLHGKLNHGSPVILCFDSWEHWVVAIGSLDDLVIVIDSANFKVNKKENGTQVYTKKQLMRRWRNGRKSIDSDRLYAIAVSKRKS